MLACFYTIASLNKSLADYFETFSIYYFALLKMNFFNSQSPVVSPMSSKASLVTELQTAAGAAKAWGETRSVDVYRVQGAGEIKLT